jgi:uncharacterized membrane protein YgdD (TMEM256/DUF423 family)
MTEHSKPDTIKRRLIITGVSGALAVALGALGAHSLKNMLITNKITVDQLNGFDTGVKYQMYHTLAMLLVILMIARDPGRFLIYAYRFFLGGIILFSGSLYLLCTRNLWDASWLSILGPVTPLGGLLFVAGWLCLAFSAIKKS